MIDFIIKFSKSENLTTDTKYNSILIVMNKFIKYTHLISCNEKFTTKQTT